MSTGRVLLGTLVGVVVAGALATGVLVLGIRRRHPGVVRAVTRYQRDVLNPRLLRSGVTDPGTAVVVHRGRRSGRTFRTPVGVVPVSEGFAVLLPYGPGADWVRNVLAAGEALVVVDGTERRSPGPRVVPVDEVVDLLPRTQRLAVRAFGVREALLLPSPG